MLSCVFAGSFDPVTAGHMDIISRAAVLFGKVRVTVMHNVHKSGSISVEERIHLLQKACKCFPNVEVDRWEGLLADYMRDRGESILIRGCRNASEFEQEYTASLVNKRLYNQFETLLIPSNPQLSAVSSSAVREVFRFGGDIAGLVPDECLKDIQKLLSKK